MQETFQVKKRDYAETYIIPFYKIILLSKFIIYIKFEVAIKKQAMCVIPYAGIDRRNIIKQKIVFKLTRKQTKINYKKRNENIQ